MSQSDRPRWASSCPHVGNIVTCLFPDDPKEKLRPCLVLQVLIGADGTSYAVRVAYGTKSLNREKRGDIDIIVDKQADMDDCGLVVPTRFDLEEFATIPWQPPLVDCWQGYNSPVIGDLPPHLQREAGHRLMAIQQKKAAAS